MLFKRLDKASGKVSFYKVDLISFYGNLPCHQNGINKGRLDFPLLAANYGWSIREINKARQAWVNVFRFEESNLTFEQYLNKLKLQRLRPNDIGTKPDKYNLA